MPQVASLNSITAPLRSPNAMNWILSVCQLGITVCIVKTLTIKLEARQDTWLTKQARSLRRSKGGIIRELIDERQASEGDSLGHALRDLCGSLDGSRNLSIRPMRGYGRA